MKKTLYIFTAIVMIAFIAVTFMWFLPDIEKSGTASDGPKQGSVVKGNSGKAPVSTPTGDATPTEKVSVTPSGAEPSPTEMAMLPSGEPTLTMSVTEPATPTPTEEPVSTGTPTPTLAPTDIPTGTPTQTPTNTPTAMPTKAPTPEPTKVPTKAPTFTPEPKKPTPTSTPVPTKAPTSTPTPEPTKAPTATPTPLPTSTPTPTLTPEPATPTPTPVDKTPLSKLQVGVHSSQYSNTYSPVSFQGTGEYYGFASVVGKQPGDGAVYKMDKSVAVSKAKEMLKQFFDCDGNDYASKFYAGKSVTLGSQPFLATGGRKTTFGAYASSVKGLYQAQAFDVEILVVADTNCVYFEKAAIADMEILVPVVRCRIIYDIRVNNPGSLYSASGLFKGIGNGEERYWQFVDVCPICVTDTTTAFGSGIVALTEPRLFR